MQSEFRVLLAVIVIRMATIASLVVAQGCARPELNAEVTRQAGTDPAQLWIEPADLESRDLFFGYGGRASVPDPDDAYRVVGVDKTGHSQGYELEDSQHRLWRAMRRDAMSRGLMPREVAHSATIRERSNTTSDDLAHLACALRMGQTPGV